MSYGVNYPEMYRRAARYADRIFKGAKPADLPVEEPTRLELVINMHTARGLGLTVPPALLLRADSLLESPGSAAGSPRGYGLREVQSP